MNVYVRAAIAELKLLGWEISRKHVQWYPGVDSVFLEKDGEVLFHHFSVEEYEKFNPGFDHLRARENWVVPWEKGVFRLEEIYTFLPTKPIGG